MIYRAILMPFLAAPAWAACPVSDDLATGIRLLADDGAVEIYRSRGPHTVELTVTYDDGYTDRSLLAQGVYILEVVELYNGQPQQGTEGTYAYPVDPDAIPVPVAGDVWRTRAVVDGSDEEKITATWGDARQITFGDCTYTVIPGEIVYTGTDYRQTEQLHYLQELGFAYLASFATDDSDVVDEYAIVSITALGPDE